MKRQDIVLFGAGKRGKTILGIINKEDYASVKVVDNNDQLWGDSICGCPIEKPFIPRGEPLWCVTTSDRAVRTVIERQLWKQ